MAKAEQQFFYKSNRLQQLRGFCLAAQFGNITKAARQMGLTTSTVSIQIKSLEDELEISLFERNGPQISLTDQGKALYETALPHVEAIQNIYAKFHEKTHTQKRTELHIAANSTTLNFILPPLLKRYLKAHQDIYVTIHYAEHHEAMEKLERGEVDLAALPKREHWPFPSKFEYTPVYDFVPCLITRADHPLAGRKMLSVEEISKYELTLPAEELRVIPNLYEIFPANNINKKLRINFRNWETTRKYIEEGLVISISSDVILAKNDTLVGTPLSHLFSDVSYGFVTRKTKLPEKVTRLIEMAKHMSR